MNSQCLSPHTGGLHSVNFDPLIACAATGKTGRHITQVHDVSHNAGHFRTGKCFRNSGYVKGITEKKSVSNVLFSVSAKTIIYSFLSYEGKKGKQKK